MTSIGQFLAGSVMNSEREALKEMNRPSRWLQEYNRNVYSQIGEDGVVEKILEIIPKNDKWCVEFGAWDGCYCSNTRYLIEDKGYHAVLIESNNAKYGRLKNKFSNNNKIITINQLVGFEKEDNLDHILNMTSIPHEFDFLSIDIDGNDYHVWKSIEKYKPKVVCIEFNPTIPTHIRFVQPPDPHTNQGSSLLSLVELGKKKGYELVSVLLFNAIFVKSEYYPLFQIESNAPEVLRSNLEAITYLFSGFDGRIFLHGYRRLPWHGIELDETQLQQLPRFLQKFPGTFTRLEHILFLLYLLLKKPGQGIAEIKKNISYLMGRCT
jgi:hypothetical protein